MIGDSVTDIEAANAFGLPSIGLAKDDKRRWQLLRAGATHTITSMSEL